MNTGELKLQNFFFNSHTQLNQNWFKQEGDSGFKSVLKSKKTDFSPRENKPSLGIAKKSSDHKRGVGVGFEQRARVDFDARQNSKEELKASIKEGVAQNKFKRENSHVTEIKEKVETIKKTIEEELEDLQAMMREALGLDQSQPVMDELALQLGIDLEVLEAAFQGLLAEEVNTGPMLEVINQLELEDVQTFIQGAHAFVVDLPLEGQNEFATAFYEVLEQMETSPVKDDLEALTLIQVEDQPVQVERFVENTDPQIQVDDKTQEPVKDQAASQASKETYMEEVTEKVTRVEVKEEVIKADLPQEHKSMVTEVVKVKTASVTQETSFEDQVNLMKAEASVISSAKGEVKVPLAKHVMNQVIQGSKMSIQMTDQGSEMIIKLNPKNLGNVALKMAFDKGVLLAEIQVENQTVKSIVESNLDQLRDSLKEEGYNIGDLDVSVNKENTGQDQQSFSQSFKKQVKTESFEEEKEKILSQNQVNDKAVDYLA